MYKGFLMRDFMKWKLIQIFDKVVDSIDIFHRSRIKFEQSKGCLSGIGRSDWTRPEQFD